MKIPNTGILIRQLQTKINSIIDEKVKEYQIGYGQFEYFIGICESPGISQQALANKLHVSKVSVNKAIAILEAANLVEKRQDGRDGRSINLHLTRGGQAAQAGIEAFKNDLEKQLFKGLDPEKIRILNETLGQINENALSFRPPQE